MNENAAIRLCLHYRDPRGFEYLVKKYRREAFVHAHSLLGNQEDAADACQESFTRAYMAISHLKALDHFYPWFYRILRNCCLNMINRRKTVKKFEREKKKDPDAVIEINTPATILERNEKQEIVHRILQALNLESREILTMKYFQGYGYDTISDLLQIPRGTVMSRLYYARKSFRELYLKTMSTTSQKEVDD